MMMVHSLCSSYHWSYEQVMKLTMPQIIMLNHASSVTNLRMERRYKTDDGSASYGDGRAGAEPQVYEGKTLKEMDSVDMARYWSNFDSE